MKRQRICVVGAGPRFFSGISVYTCRLTNALAQREQISAILMRQLLPTRLYPGRARVGAQLTQLRYDPAVPVYDGVDWYWLPSMLRAISFLLRERPEVVIFQWWTGTVFHSYLLLAAVARLLGAEVVIEFHEVLDTGEARLNLARLYVGLVAPLLTRLAQGFVVHSQFDRAALEDSYKLGDRPVALIPHGPYDHYQSSNPELAQRAAPAECCNLLYFGVIRPYKGVEDLLTAFDAIAPEEINKYWLTIVGETWEGWNLPAELIAASRYHARITFVNRYVRDDEVMSFFAGADAVVLPYHRSSASGPLHIAMSCGLPVVVTQVGGLTEAVASYEGAIMIPPQAPAALGVALNQLLTKLHHRFPDPHSWERTVARFEALFMALSGDQTALGEVLV